MKRFKYNEFSRCIKDNKTGYIYSDLKEIEKLLNEKSEVEQLSEIDDTRFVFYPTSNYIKDRLTGETFFCNNRRVCLLLNKLDEKANKNAERYFELMASGGVDPVAYHKFLDVMKKYGISSVEKLDQVLFNQRVW